MKLGILFFVVFFSWSGLACAFSKGHIPKPKPLEEYKSGSFLNAVSNSQSKNGNAKNETNDSLPARSPHINYGPVRINYNRPRI